ncbi:MAG: glycosyltransferase family 2 protein [Spirochaetes bacterium]|nr:glycosyltransferase family 2 protein [Spirochaetota bacterium]
MKISIIIPVYNEEESLNELYKRIKKNVKGKYSYEIIFIDDGSTDNSFRVLLTLKKKDKNIAIIKMKRNFGKSQALDAGFKKARGEYIITMDADLQDEPDEIPELINQLNRSSMDAISGWKFKRHDPFIKKVTSRLFNFVVRSLTGVKLHDMNCGLKIYKKIAIQDLKLYGDMHRFIPVLLRINGYHCGEMKVKHNPRKYGKTKYGPSRFLIGLLDFFTVIFLSKFMKKPLHLFGTVGLICELIGGIAAMYIALLKILYGTIQHRLPLLNFGVLLIIVGIQFISIGLLGELLVNRETAKKDYHIDKII